MISSSDGTGVSAEEVLEVCGDGEYFDQADLY